MEARCVRAPCLERFLCASIVGSFDRVFLGIPESGLRLAFPIRRFLLYIDHLVCPALLIRFFRWLAMLGSIVAIGKSPSGQYT